MNIVHLMRLQKADEYKIWEKIKTFLLNISKDLKQKPTKSKTKFPELSFFLKKLSSFHKKVFFRQKQSFFVKQRNVTLS